MPSSRASTNRPAGNPVQGAERCLRESLTPRHLPHETSSYVRPSDECACSYPGTTSDSRHLARMGRLYAYLGLLKGCNQPSSSAFRIQYCIDKRFVNIRSLIRNSNLSQCCFFSTSQKRVAFGGKASHPWRLTWVGWETRTFLSRIRVNQPYGLESRGAAPTHVARRSFVHCKSANATTQLG